MFNTLYHSPCTHLNAETQCAHIRLYQKSIQPYLRWRRSCRKSTTYSIRNRQPHSSSFFCACVRISIYIDTKYISIYISANAITTAMCVCVYGTHKPGTGSVCANKGEYLCLAQNSCRRCLARRSSPKVIRIDGNRPVDGNIM